VFKLDYRVSFNSANGKVDNKDFVLGWCAYIPTIEKDGESVKEEEI
jgi:hypothetical protein